MDILKEKILKEGIVLNSQVLKVDSFLNHQIDPILMKEIGKEFAKRFDRYKVTKVLTLESSGIAPALMTALELGVPVIFARKRKSVTLNQDLITTSVYSFTKEETNEITISKRFIDKEDRIIIIDDFLANGEAGLGLIRLVEQSEAKMLGAGFVIEKAFQNGAQKLRGTGYRIESLVSIESLDHQQIKFAR